MQNKKIYFFGIESMKMHCNFTYPTNAFYPKFCKIKNSRGYERNRISGFSYAKIKLSTLVLNTVCIFKLFKFI